MKTTNKIIQLAKVNNGIVTTSMITSAGYSRGFLQYLVKKGKLEKSARGVYILPEVLDDEFFNLQNQFKRGVYSHETALFLWGLTDRTPHQYHMTFPSSYNLTTVKKENIQCSQCKNNFYNLGIENITSPSGNMVNVYSRERTLCDIIRPQSYVDIQIISEAFKNYVNSSSANIPLLSKYAKLLKVEKKIRLYLEVLL